MTPLIVSTSFAAITKVAFDQGVSSLLTKKGVIGVAGQVAKIVVLMLFSYQLALRSADIEKYSNLLKKIEEVYNTKVAIISALPFPVALTSVVSHLAWSKLRAQPFLLKEVGQTFLQLYTVWCIVVVALADD